MSTDYTVIMVQKHQFGDDPGIFKNVESDVTFEGPTMIDVLFDCPNINPALTAVLMFQSRDVEFLRNILRINDVDVPGALAESAAVKPTTSELAGWNGTIQIIDPRHNLKATGNRLHVEARNSGGGGGGELDDFILDNMVIMYKTLPRQPANQI
ncbi:MAG: hypothetical protein WA584_10565 [Pyrinomonadaceae bacterium]